MLRKYSKIATALLAFCYILLAVPAIMAGNMESIKSNNQQGNSPLNTAAASTGSLFSAGRRNVRSIYGLGPKMMQISRSKIPIELDLLVENDEADRSKRFDDYGHMRFGKRGGEEQFDDYGHMRFGRSV